jgi:Xaa-Pro aminopeptidase
MPRLIACDWPDFGPPDLPPPITLAELEDRLSAVRAALAARHLSALVVYGDREHAANLHWLTGFDPRFEEAVLIVTADRLALLVGNECLPYAQVSPLVAAGRVTVDLVPSLSLISQPRAGRRIAEALGDHLAAAALGTIGAAGWKYFGADEVEDPETTLDLPDFLAAPLRRIAQRVVNATDLLMHPGHGLRTLVDAAEIARLEFANAMAARALTRMVRALREGMTDFEAVEAAQVGGLPLGCHLTFATGARAGQGLSGPTGQVIRRGSPLSFNICHWGANICRAGWVATGPGDLPPNARGHVTDFAGPYVAAMSEWCALMRPGIGGGQVWARMRELLPFDRFGVALNPGHLIGLDEWISSPIAEGSDLPLRSGMAMQMDVIPCHPDHASTRMEDGYVIADAALRAELARRFPAVADRIGRRAAFMREVIGMTVPETLLPLSDTCGIVAPWLLDHRQVIAL